MISAAGVRRFVVYLVKPSKYDDEGYVIRHWRGVLPSNTLACLYGLTEDVRRRGALGPLEWETHLVDETVQKVQVRRIARRGRRRDTRVIVCLVGVQSNQFARAEDLALEFRALGVDVLIGGFHVSGSLAMLSEPPPEIRRLSDAGVTLVAGEIEGRWEGILRDALLGTLRPLYNFLAEPPDLRSAPLPQVNSRYLKRFVAPNFGTLDCGRGCPFNCSFCTVINVQGRAMRFRAVERLLSLIRENYREHRISYYFFTDDNFCRNKNWEAFFDGLIRLRAEEGIRVAFMIQADTQSHKLPGFVAKAKEAGCSQVFIGIESLNPQNLEAAGKRQNRTAEFRELIETYRRAGIHTHVAYIIGFPFDTAESVREDVDRLQSELGPEQASFFMLTPLPGSRDHLERVRSGAPSEPDLNRYDSFQVTTPHPRMSAEAWQKAYQDAWESFYGLENMKAILRRVRPENYWNVFANFVWYKNSTQVERGHPMIHGFFRIKDRLQRRPGVPVQTPWKHFRRQAADLGAYARLWVKLALEMEEVWLQTRPRGDMERRVIETLQQRSVRAKQWRALRLSDLQEAYRRAAALLKGAQGGAPSSARLWLKQRNCFSQSLTHSRQPLQRFWRDTRVRVKSGQLHRVDVSRSIFHLAEEGVLFFSFASAFFGRLLFRLRGDAGELAAQGNP